MYIYAFTQTCMNNIQWHSWTFKFSENQKKILTGILAHTFATHSFDQLLLKSVVSYLCAKYCFIYVMTVVEVLLQCCGCILLNLQYNSNT